MTADPRRWSAASVDRTWNEALEPIRSTLLEAAHLAERQAPLTELKPSPELRAAVEPHCEPVREALESGRGFVVQQGLSGEGLSDREATAAYWLLGHCLGRPVQQNVQGTLLYDVRDTGQSVEYGARFSVTNADSSFHTDNSFGEAITDYVGLLCLREARSGGVNQLVSGWSVLEKLASDHPEALEVLGSPFHIDRRGGAPEGESETVRLPVIGRTGEGEPLFRYLRYWIQVGHEKAGEPLDADQSKALDLLDETLGSPELRADLTLRPGEILWVNNRWILHSRTGFEDYEEPERRRHLVRLWLEHF